MNNFIENRLSMYKDVKGICDQNIALMNANAGRQAAYQAYLLLLTEMDEISKEQIKIRTGVTIDKQHARDKLDLAIEAASGIIMAHFDQADNFNIYNQVNYRLDELQRMPDQIIIAHGHLVAGLLLQHVAVLAPFDIDIAYINAFNVVLADYIAVVARPTMERNAKKALTKLLLLKSRVISTFLRNVFDKAMLPLKKTDYDIWLMYRNGRRIVNNGIRHIKKGVITGIVKNNENNEPLEDALVEIVGTETLIVTNDMGSFTISDVPVFTYTLKVSISGFDVKMIENVVVTARETTTLEVRMVETE